MLWILVGMSQALAGTLPCPSPYDNPALASRLHEAEQSFGTLDLEGFRSGSLNEVLVGLQKGSPKKAQRG